MGPALIALAAALAAPGGTIVETATGRTLTAEALAGRLADADVAVLGEVHDNPDHHLRQAWLIGRLDPAAVAFEMIPSAADLSGLPEDPEARLEALPRVLDWEALGWPEWSLYAPVFEAAANARLIGAGVPREALVEAMEGGAAAAFGEGADRAGLTAVLDAATIGDLTDEMRVSHCNALPDEMMPGMIEAQRLRDARFAAAALDGLDAGGSAVLVTGNGHARTDRGVPAVIRGLRPGTTVLSLGQLEEGDGRDPRDAPFDFVWVSAAAERDDPCAVFEKG